MCQLCDEANAYLAEVEARAKAREDEKRKAGTSADRDTSSKTPAVAR
jgi:hypothetical protein